MMPCNRKEIKEHSSTGSKAQSHSLFTQVLKKHVSQNGEVDYIGIQSNRNFSSYLSQLQSGHPDSKSWSREERLAYWINAYNAFTLKLVIDHYPVESIKDIPNCWSREFIQIEDTKYSLEQIEHSILRDIYKEPRIHFAINCASFSCPKLQPFAFEAQELEDQLEKVTHSFINDINRNQISADKLELSKIFRWFKSDFTNTSSLKEFIQKYTAVNLDEATKIEYLEYNWELNEYSP
ncbi:MAG: DUF547 domain-containing protein [Bacteroidota bacterium]